jgi:hypothetical protein
MSNDAMRKALAELEKAEAHYRLTFQIAPSADHLDVGRAWDRMRKAGDMARAALAQSEAQPPPVGVLIRGEGGEFRFSCGDHLLALYAMPPGEHDLYASSQQAQPDKWRETVDDMLSVCHAVASDDPRESVNRLINWHVQVALDPCVSSDAQALIDRGRQQAQPVPETLSEGEVDDLSREMVKGGKSVNWLCRTIERIVIERMRGK